MKEVKLKIRRWQGVDGAGFDRVINMCDLHFRIESGEIWHDYFEPRAWNNKHCLEFQKEWARLTKGERYICLSGDAFRVENQRVDGVDHRVKAWQWYRIKTKKGCYCYRDGGCDY